MSNVSKAVATLRSEYSRLEKEMEGVKRALDALGSANGNKPRRAKRFLSKEARERIAEAQRQRWAKARKAAKQAK